jgi:transposase
VVPDSIVYSDSWRGYKVLDISDFHHFRINHSRLFADSGTKPSGTCANSTVFQRLISAYS